MSVKLRKVGSPLRIAMRYFKYNLVQPLVKRPFLPKYLIFYVNYRCNAHCIMCGIWETNASYPQVNDFTLEELDRVLADRLFSKIESMNIQGGELTLRSDLPEMVQTAVNRLPALREIRMVSNGLSTTRLVSHVKQIKQICASQKLAFSVCISVHGLDEIGDKVYGIKGAFEKQVESITALQEIAAEGNFQLTLSCVIQNENIDHLQSLRQWVHDRKLKIGFVMVEKRFRFGNLEKGDQFEIDASNKPAAIEFFRELSNHKSLSPSAYVYDYLANLLQYNQVRTMSCDYSLGGVILGSQGEIFYCPHDEAIGNCRDRSAYEIYYDAHNLEHRNAALIQQKCLHCPPKEYGRESIQADVFKYMKFLITTRLRRRRNPVDLS